MKLLAKGYHKLLAYKDEYEVARLHAGQPRQKAREVFEGDFAMTLPPGAAGAVQNWGRRSTRETGIWRRNAAVVPAACAVEGAARDTLRYLWAHGRTPDGTGLDQAISNATWTMCCPSFKRRRTKEAIIASLQNCLCKFSGFGPVKAANEAKAAKRREELLALIRSGAGSATAGGRVVVIYRCHKGFAVGGTG